MASKEWPLVSIVITSYNREKWIGRTIQSAIDQDYPNLEIIISDNKSTDNSAAVIKEFTHDSRVIFFQHHANIGMLANFKKAIEELASGEFITHVSSDDYLTDKSFISAAVLSFKQYSNMVGYSGVSKNFYLESGTEKHNAAYRFKSDNDLFNKLLPGRKLFWNFQFSHILNAGGTVYRRKEFVELDVCREPNTIYVDLQALLLLSLKYDFYLSDKECYMQTFHDNNISQAHTNAAQSLLNLSFAEVPFVIAEQKEDFFTKEQLKSWLHNILKPVIYTTMRALYERRSKDYEDYTTGIFEKYPEIYSEINNDKKWRMVKMFYSNPLTRFLFNKILKIKNAGH